MAKNIQLKNYRKSSNTRERQNGLTRRELLDIIQAVKHFNYCIYGAHSPIEKIMAYYLPSCKTFKTLKASLRERLLNVTINDFIISNAIE